MDKIEKILIKYGFKQNDIDKFFTFYDYAVKKKIPYPIYYAIAKLRT